jgi:hypothetical protein
MLFHRSPKYKYLLVSETNERLTFQAPDDQVAFICGLWLGNQIAICYRIEGNSLVPVVSYFERPYNPDEYAWQFLKDNPGWYKQAHRPEIWEAWQTIVCLRPMGGEMLTRYLGITPWMTPETL